MIVLLSCSMNSLGSDAQHSSTGGLEQDSITQDSVLIAYSDLRKVNSKLIELKYEKEINNELRKIVKNDSIVITENNSEISKVRKQNIRYRKERNIAGGAGITAIILFIISLL